MLRFLVERESAHYNYNAKGCGEIDRTAQVSYVVLIHQGLFILLMSKPGIFFVHFFAGSLRPAACDALSFQGEKIELCNPCSALSSF